VHERYRQTTDGWATSHNDPAIVKSHTCLEMENVWLINCKFVTLYYNGTNLQTRSGFDTNIPFRNK